VTNKRLPPPDGSEVPQEFAASAPRELHATSDIRFVMRETAALSERIEGLSKAIEKLGPGFDKALEKNATDLKERIADLKSDAKESVEKIREIENSVSFVKGVMWVLGGLFAIAIVILGVVARKAIE